MAQFRRSGIRSVLDWAVRRLGGCDTQLQPTRSARTRRAIRRTSRRRVRAPNSSRYCPTTAPHPVGSVANKQIEARLVERLTALGLQPQIQSDDRLQQPLAGVRAGRQRAGAHRRRHRVEHPADGTLRFGADRARRRRRRHRCRDADRSRARHAPHAANAQQRRVRVHRRRGSRVCSGPRRFSPSIRGHSTSRRSSISRVPARRDRRCCCAATHGAAP